VATGSLTVVACGLGEWLSVWRPAPTGVPLLPQPVTAAMRKHTSATAAPGLNLE
jgi:hypothetical protein